MTGSEGRNERDGDTGACETDAPGYEEHNAQLRWEARIAAIVRDLSGAIEQAAAELSELGLPADDVAEWIQSAWECSDWAESLHLDGCTLPGDHDGPCDV